MWLFPGFVGFVVVVVGSGCCGGVVLFASLWFLCSALCCAVEEFSAPCVAASDCFAVLFEVSGGSI